MRPINFVQNEVVTGVAPTLETQLPGLQQLWAQTMGDPRICIAILDGPVDLTHPSLREAALTQIDLDAVTDSGAVSLSDHGTHVTSIIFGSHDGPVKGIAPNCRGLIIPIFRYAADGSLEPCSQERLAKAMRAAVRFGANVINISAGQFSSRGEASPELRAAIEECGEDVLIVSAAGNDGCDCLHVPGALPLVLAVGAMSAEGRPLPFSNWGAAYREQGVLAPGERILGAAGDGGVKAQSGTSFSTPIVSGVAGLLLSLQQKLGIVPSSKSIRNAILETTHGCDPQTESQCERVLAGRLSISGSVTVVTRGMNIMQNATNSPGPAEVISPPVAGREQAANMTVDSVEPSACCGGCAGMSKQFVYAIGEVDYDFSSLARLNSLQQCMATLDSTGQQLNVQNRLDFARHLCGFKEHKLDAASGLLSWNPADPVETVGADTGFKLVIKSGDDLIKEDDYRCILIHGARERERLPNGNWGPWRAWLSNGQSLHIGTISNQSVFDPKAFILRTAQPFPDSLYQYDFEDATWVLPRDCDSHPRVHAPHEYDAQAVIWKLRRGSTNMYAIKPGGNYSEAAYGELIGFLLEGQGFERNGLDIYYNDTPHGRQLWSASWDPGYNTRDCCLANQAGGSHACCTNYQKQSTEHFPARQARLIERSQRVSIPGMTRGDVQILNGETLTEIAPDMRGTHSWSLVKLHQSIKKAILNLGHSKQLHIVIAGLDNILIHLDERVRNRGLSAQDRALNYAATRMVDILPNVASSLIVPGDKEKTASTLELDVVSTPTKSETCPAGSDCWDVEIAFFDPNNSFAARIIVSQAVDVSDVIPYRVEDPKQYRMR